MTSPALTKIVKDGDEIKNHMEKLNFRGVKGKEIETLHENKSKGCLVLCFVLKS